MTTKINRPEKPSILESLQVRWEQAIKEAKDAGVQISENVFSCCGSCVNLVDLDIDGAKPYGWTPGYQGQGYEWQDANSPIHYEDDVVEDDQTGEQLWEEDEIRTYGEPVDHIYFHHDNGAAVLIVKAFTAHGFTAEWNGSDGQCVKVLMK